MKWLIALTVIVGIALFGLMAGIGVLTVGSVFERLIHGIT